MHQDVIRGIGGINKLKDIEILGFNSALFHQKLEVNQVVPVFFAHKNYGNRINGLCLDQGERFKKFVQCAESAGKSHKPLGPFQKVHFPYCKVMELKAQFRRNVGIGFLLKGQNDIQADALSANV